jgi:5-amino-6-(5-phosphoribosylamino)uracil reductase
MPARDTGTVSAVPVRPYTIASCAVSVDGCLDDASPTRLILSGPEDLDEVDELRAAADAILVGAGTIRADNPRLLIRDAARVARRERDGRPPHPLRVTVTATGDLNPEAHFFTGPGMPLVYAPARAARAARDNLGERGVIIDAGERLTLGGVLEDLYTERTVATVLIEGGAEILREALSANLADELRLAIAPFFVGDEAAPRFAPPASYPHDLAHPMTLLSVRQVGGVAVHHYRLLVPGVTRFRQPVSAPPTVGLVCASWVSSTCWAHRTPMTRYTTSGGHGTRSRTS